MQDHPLTPDDRDLERALRLLPPASDGPPLNPTVAAFAAGRRSARGQIRLWRSATAAALLLAIISPLALRSTPEPRAPIAQPVAMVDSRPYPTQSLLMLQNTIGQHGLTGLRGTAIPSVSPVRPNDKL